MWPPPYDPMDRTNLWATQLQIPSRLPPSPQPPQTISITKPSRPYALKATHPCGIYKRRHLTHQLPSLHAAPPVPTILSTQQHSTQVPRTFPIFPVTITLPWATSSPPQQHPGRMIRFFPSHPACHPPSSVFNSPKHDYHQYKFYQLK